MYSKRVFLECANDIMWTDKTKMHFVGKKKDGHCYKFKNLLAQVVLWIDWESWKAL